MQWDGWMECISLFPKFTPDQTWESATWKVLWPSGKVLSRVRKADSWDSCQLPHSPAGDLFCNNYLFSTRLSAKLDQSYQMIGIAVFCQRAPIISVFHLQRKSWVMGWAKPIRRRVVRRCWVESAENPITPSRFHSIVLLFTILPLSQYGTISNTYCLNTI